MSEIQRYKDVSAIERVVRDVPGLQTSEAARHAAMRSETASMILHTLRDQGYLPAQRQMGYGPGRPALLWFIAGTGSLNDDDTPLPLNQGDGAAR